MCILCVGSLRKGANHFARLLKWKSTKRGRKLNLDMRIVSSYQPLEHRACLAFLASWKGFSLDGAADILKVTHGREALVALCSAKSAVGFSLSDSSDVC